MFVFIVHNVCGILQLWLPKLKKLVAVLENTPVTEAS